MGKIAIIIVVISLIGYPSGGQGKPKVIVEPGKGKLYHAAYPGSSADNAEEDDITANDIKNYENAAGKKIAWVYFSNSWYKGKSRLFPTKTAKMIRDGGAVPYVRLMLWESFAQNQTDPTFTLENIIKGKFDSDFKAWAKGAKEFGSPILAEYGTEANGDWFPWNGVWNGGAVTDKYGDKKKADGPERFRDAYRRIIRISSEQGAKNIKWVFHANHSDWPNEDWNRFEEYYPGDDWIDWIGVSAYGAQTPMQDEVQEFRNMMDKAYPRLAKLSAKKPIAVLEFACTSGHPKTDQAKWAEAALKDITSFRWPRVMAFSWWNDHWTNDDDPAHNTNMRVQDNAKLKAVFQKIVKTNVNILGRPIIK